MQNSMDCGQTEKIGKKKKQTFVTMNALILPVCGMCGPTHRSIIGPQR